MPTGNHTLAGARDAMSTADCGIETVWRGRTAVTPRAAQCLRAKVAHRPKTEVRMKRGIQCPELGRDQLPLLPLYVALVQRVEAGGWPLNAQAKNQPAAEAQHAASA